MASLAWASRPSRLFSRRASARRGVAAGAAFLALFGFGVRQLMTPSTSVERVALRQLDVLVELLGSSNESGARRCSRLLQIPCPRRCRGTSLL